MNFSCMSAFHRLTFFMNCSSMGFFPQCVVLQEQTAPAWVPHRVTSPASKAAPAWAPLSTGPHPSRSLLQRTLSMRSQPPSDSDPFGVLHGLQVDICSAMDLHGLQGDSLPHHGLHHKLLGNLSSSAWRVPPPPASLSFVSAELFLSHILTPLSPTVVGVVPFFFTF